MLPECFRKCFEVPLWRAESDLSRGLPVLAGGDSATAGPAAPPHLLVVPLHVGQLLVQALDLHLQVGLGQGQLVQHPAQAVDVGLHALTQGQLILIPNIFLNEKQHRNGIRN